MSITIKNFKHANHHSIKANFGFVIDLWGIEICDCKLIATKTGGYFIGFPSREYLDPADNSKKFYMLVRMIDPEKHKALQEKVLQALKEFMSKLEPSQPEPVQEIFPF